LLGTLCTVMAEVAHKPGLAMLPFFSPISGLFSRELGFLNSNELLGLSLLYFFAYAGILSFFALRAISRQSTAMTTGSAHALPEHPNAL
jgi:hypothetical protein